MQTILIVDDNPLNLTVLGELLCEHCTVRAANSGERALQLVLQEPVPDLVLLDVMMPGMNGYQVLERLRADPRSRGIPVIFTTALAATEDEQRGLALGAVDYITKPLRPSIVLARVNVHLELKRARDMLHQRNLFLTDEVDSSLRENLTTQEVSLRGLARLAETRDNETGNHILRTQAYVHLLAQRASALPGYADQLGPRAIELIATSAPLHDIGKVGIPDSVLLKPGQLTADEWKVMRSHARVGADVIGRAIADTRRPVAFMAYAYEIALHHHERWDGNGYPDGLAGDDIPLAARLMAIADVFDALVSRRVYKPSMTFEVARGIMEDQSGKHFDPALLQLFLDSFEEFCNIARLHPEDDRVDEHPKQPAVRVEALSTVVA